MQKNNILLMFASMTFIVWFSCTTKENNVLPSEDTNNLNNVQDVSQKEKIMDGKALKDTKILLSMPYTKTIYEGVNDYYLPRTSYERPPLADEYDHLRKEVWEHAGPETMQYLLDAIFTNTSKQGAMDYMRLGGTMISHRAFKILAGVKHKEYLYLAFGTFLPT